MTCGGEQSNHCRATAASAARLGLSAHLFLRTTDPLSPPKITGNILLNRMLGSKIQWISHAEYTLRDTLMKETAEALSQTGTKTYVIPEGGSNPLGSWGYIEASQEIMFQLAEIDKVSETSVVYACGSGGTGAGLIIGMDLYHSEHHPLKVYGINVCDSREYFQRKIGDIIEQFHIEYGATPELDINIIDGYVGRGYAQSTAEELREIHKFAVREGIFLDPVYSGKAFFGIVNELKKNPRCFGDRIVFIHTGGIFGLFAKSNDIDAICTS